MEQYRHFKKGVKGCETVEFDIMEGDQYITTCVIDAPSFHLGKNTFPCGNGDYMSLSIKQRLEIESLFKAESRGKEPMVILSRENGAIIKLPFSSIKTILYEIAENLFSCSYLESFKINPSETMMVIYLKNGLPISLIANNWIISHE